MVYQFYIIEITRNAQGELAHNVYWAWDENQNTARLKGEAKYHEVLSAAAISEYQSHGAILISSDCFPVENKCYTHGDPVENAVSQFYVIEIQRDANGDLSHNVHWAWDSDFDTAQLKGESKFHERVAVAALSNTESHGAILIGSDCSPVMNKCYTHEIEPTVTEEPVDAEPVEEETTEPVEETTEETTEPTE